MLNHVFGKSIVHPLLSGNEFLGHPLEIKKSKREDIACLEKLAIDNNWKPTINIKQVLRPLTAVIVTDTEQTIQWVSSYFHKMTGYTPEEAIGKKPRFLQGPETSQTDKEKIRFHL
ncbi:MAG: PAS domain S-box protein [Cytophagales bacterium]|nr:PAS domain S-box protein [Cytophagales bacterium]